MTIYCDLNKLRMDTLNKLCKFCMNQLKLMVGKSEFKKFNEFMSSKNLNWKMSFFSEKKFNEHIKSFFIYNLDE